MRREDVLDRHLAVGRLVDEPVVSLDQGARSVRGTGNGAHRTLCHLPRALDQAQAQTRVARPSTCEAKLRQETPGRIRNRHNLYSDNQGAKANHD